MKKIIPTLTALALLSGTAYALPEIRDTAELYLEEAQEIVQELPLNSDKQKLLKNADEVSRLGNIMIIKKGNQIHTITMDEDEFPSEYTIQEKPKSKPKTGFLSGLANFSPGGFGGVPYMEHPYGGIPGNDEQKLKLAQKLDAQGSYLAARNVYKELGMIEEVKDLYWDEAEFMIHSKGKGAAAMLLHAAQEGLEKNDPDKNKFYQESQNLFLEAAKQAEKIEDWNGAAGWYSKVDGMEDKTKEMYWKKLENPPQSMEERVDKIKQIEKEQQEYIKYEGTF